MPYQALYPSLIHFSKPLLIPMHQLRSADALFRLAHTGSFGVATQALLLLHQLMSSRNSISDRFYRALYASLLSPELPRSTKGPMFLSLLYKAVGTDVSPRRVAAFIKRLLQVATEAPANFACGCLMLASQVMKAKPGMWNAVLQPEDKEDDAVETLQDAVDPGNSRKAVQRDGENGEASDSDEEEDMEPDLPSTSGRKTQRGTSLEAAQKPGGGKDGDGPDGSWPSEGGYDMRKRDPQYSHADRACLWELLPLASHAHPSVAAMARTLLAGANVSYDGDPLQMLTLGAFLDKFVQRKAKAGVKGDSAMQPLRAPTTAAAHGHQDLALAEIAGGAAGDVAPDEAFFHTFYSVQAARQPGAAKKKKSAAAAKADDDEELVSDLDDSDSDAADEFLAGEEDGGDEGIGADPDRAAGYDYDQLGAAMDEDSDLGSGSERGGGSEEASIDEEGSLEGAEFSDLSGDEDGSGPDAGGSDEDDSGGEGSLDSLDSLEDLTDDSGSSEDDAAADAEVAELLRRHASAQKQPPMGTKRARTEALMPAQAGNGSLNDLVDEVDEDVNPFELAEGTDSGTDADSDVDSDSDGEGEEGHPSSDEEKQASSDGSGPSDSDIDFDEGLDSDSDDGAGGGRGKRKGDGAVFASADDYAHLIEKDLAGEVDEGEVEAVRTAVLGAKKGKRPSSGGRGGKRQRR